MAETTEEPFEPVTLTQEQQNRKLVVPFFTTVAATAQITNVASKISHRFRITKIEIHFRDDTANNLQVRVYASDSADAPTTNPPTGTNIVGKFSNTPYIVGQGQTIIIDCNYIPSFYETWLKVHLTNTNAYALTSMVLVTIESITLEEAQELIEESTFNIKIKDPEEYTEEIINKSIAQFEAMDTTLQGTYVPLKQPIQNFLTTSKQWLQENQQMYWNVMNITNYSPLDWKPEERYKLSKEWLDDTVETVKNMEFQTGIMEAVAGAIGVPIKDWGRFLEEMFGLKAKTAKLLDFAFDKGLYKPVEQYWNKMYQPEYPQTADLINMVVKETLPLKDFQEIMTYHGYSHFWSQKIWDAHFQQPDFSTVREAYWRGGIPAEEIEQYLKLVDLDPRYNDPVWKTLLENIPTYSDLINMRTKEVIDQKTFEKGLNFLGYYGDWAQRLWDAHFDPPTFTDLVTAFRRKRIVDIPKPDGTTEMYAFGSNTGRDINKLMELAVLVDYDPRYLSFFKERIYEDLSPRQARWGYEEGAINEAKVLDICRRSGLTEEDAQWFTKTQVGFQERPFITRYLNGLMAAYIAEAITADELKTRVKAIPRREAIADWIIKIADLRKEVTEKAPESEKEKLLSVTDLKRAYIYGKISEDDFRTRLQLLGYEIGDVQLLIDVINMENEIAEAGGKKTALTVSEYLSAWRYGQLSEDQLRTELMSRGLDLNEADILINTKKVQWKLEEGGELA